MTPADTTYYSTTQNAVQELSAFGMLCKTHDKPRVTLELQDDGIHHLTLAKESLPQAKDITRFIVSALREVLQKASKHDVLRTITTGKWEDFKAAKRVLNVACAEFSLPKISLKKETIYQETDTAKAALSSLYEQLAERSEGTFAISQMSSSECALHILQASGQIITYPFPLVTEPSGSVVLVDGEKRYPDIGAFLTQLQINQLYESLFDKQPGAYTAEHVAGQNILCVKMPSGKIDSFYYGFQLKEQPVFMLENNRYFSVVDLIKSKHPELAVIAASNNRVLDPHADSVGTYAVQGSGFTTEVWVVTNKNSVVKIPCTSDVRLEQCCVIRGKSYKSLQAFVQEHTSWKLQEHKLDTMPKISPLYPSLTESHIRLELTDLAPGTFCLYEGKMYVVMAHDVVQEFPIPHNLAEFSQGFTPRVEKVQVMVHPYHTIRSKHIQIKTIDKLRKEYGSTIGVTEQIPLLAHFEDVQPMPFFLREVPKENKGDFTLVAGFQCSLMGTEMPIWQQTIEVLPDGKIADVSKGGYGRIFDSVSHMKQLWTLGGFIYDAFVKEESECSTARAAAELVKSCPHNCFLLGRTDASYFVCVQTKKNLEPLTYTLDYADGSFSLMQQGRKIPIEEELIQFLERRFGVRSLGAIKRLHDALMPYLDSGPAADDLARYSRIAPQGPVFSVIQKGNEFELTTFTPPNLMWRLLSSTPTITRETFSVSSTGQVRFQGNKTFNSVDTFIESLRTMGSLKLLEAGVVAPIAHFQKEVARDALFETFKTLPGFVEGGRAYVEALLAPYRRELSVLPGDNYVIYRERDGSGEFQLYCSFVDTDDIKHLRVAQTDIERLATGESIFNGTPFLANLAEIEKIKLLNTQALQELQADQNFKDITSQEAKNRLIQLKTFFADVDGAWLIRPEVSTRASLFSEPRPLDATRCELVLMIKGKVCTLPLAIDLRSGKYISGDNLFDTIEQAVVEADCDPEKGYCTLFEGMAACKALEADLAKAKNVKKLDERRFEIGHKEAFLTVDTRTTLGKLTSDDGTTYDDLDDVCASLDYVAKKPAVKKPVRKIVAAELPQIDLKEDVRYERLGVGKDDKTPVTRVRRLVLWLDILTDAKSRVSKKEAKLILTWLEGQDKIKSFLKKSLRTMKLPQDGQDLTEKEVRALLQDFLKTAR